MLSFQSAPAAQAVLALQGSRHDAGTSSGMGATGQHAVATSVQHIQTTLPQQIKQTQQRQELHQKLQSYQQVQRNLQSQQPGHILQHVIHQQQQQQRQQQLQQQQPGSSVQHSIPHHQQHRSQKTQQQQHHQQQQQQVQQSAGIQVSLTFRLKVKQIRILHMKVLELALEVFSMSHFDELVLVLC